MRKWDENLWLLTPEEFEQFPIGTVFVDIFGKNETKGIHEIDMDTRGGCLAFGFTNELIDAQSSEVSDLFYALLLKN